MLGHEREGRGRGRDGVGACPGGLLKLVFGGVPDRAAAKRKMAMNWLNSHRNWPGRYQNVERDMRDPILGVPGPRGAQKGPKMAEKGFQGIWKICSFWGPLYGLLK